MQILEGIIILALILYVLKLHNDVDELCGCLKKLAAIVNDHVDHVSDDRDHFTKLWNALDEFCILQTGLANDILELRKDVDKIASSDHPTALIVQDTPSVHTDGIKWEGY